MPFICDVNQKSSGNQDVFSECLSCICMHVCIQCHGHCILTLVSVVGTILVMFGGMTQVPHARILRFKSPQSISKQ